MGYSSVVLSALALSALAAAVPSIRDNSLDAGERVVLVSPVLAPPRDSRLHDTTRSRQFPILVLLAKANPQYEYGRLEPEGKSLKNPQPIYVQKLEDLEQPGLNRQKRHLSKKFGGGGYGGGYGGHGGGYQQPSKVIIVVQPQGHGGGHHHGGGGYGGYQQPNYNHGGGGYGGSYATATATATANAQSGSYGKR